MSDYEYDLTVGLRTDMPVDVLVEHVGYALRGIVDPAKRKGYVKVKVNGIRKPRLHPFDGPEVNDDMPEPEFKVGDVVEILSGKRRDDWADTPIVGTLPLVPETMSAEFVELDLDDVLGAVYTAIGEDFPNLADLFRAKAAEHVARSAEITDPPAEGDWQLDTTDHVGEDID